jgi:hypothetical protein
MLVASGTDQTGMTRYDPNVFTLNLEQMLSGEPLGKGFPPCVVRGILTI